MPTCGWSTITLKGLSIHVRCLCDHLSKTCIYLYQFLNMFLFFYFIHRSYGDPVHCRKALHRAVQCTSDYPEHVSEVLLTFERVEGEYRFKDNIKIKVIIKVKKVFMNSSVSLYFVSSPTGSLEDWDVAVQKTETRLNRINEQRAKVGAHISIVPGRCIR